jgi:chemotaxis signal transduction protein
VISVVVLQNCVDLLNSELGSSNKTRVTSTLDGYEVIGIQVERISDITEVADQETTSIPAIKTEPNVSCVPVVSVTHVSCRRCPELPVPVSLGPCETKI